MFTRVRSVETDNAHSFLSMEYIIFSSFFIAFSSYYYYTCTRLIILSLSPYISSSFLCPSYTFSFHQQNSDNGFVLLNTNIHTKYCAPVLTRLLFFFFLSNSSALQIFHSLFNKFPFNTFCLAAQQNLDLNMSFIVFNNSYHNTFYFIIII